MLLVNSFDHMLNVKLIGREKDNKIPQYRLHHQCQSGVA